MTNFAKLHKLNTKFNVIKIDTESSEDYGLDPVQYFIDSKISYVRFEDTLVLAKAFTKSELHKIAGPAIDNDLIEII
jgi:hypothetical protein